MSFLDVLLNGGGSIWSDQLHASDGTIDLISTGWEIHHNNVDFSVDYSELPDDGPIPGDDGESYDLAA